jgi:hypothetical protein
MWLLIMWYIPDFMFQIAPEKKNRILLDQESDVAKVSRHLYSYLSQGIVSECIAGIRTSFILLPPHDHITML